METLLSYSPARRPAFPLRLSSAAAATIKAPTTLHLRHRTSHFPTSTSSDYKKSWRPLAVRCSTADRGTWSPATKFGAVKSLLEVKDWVDSRKDEHPAGDVEVALGGHDAKGVYNFKMELLQKSNPKAALEALEREYRNCKDKRLEDCEKCTAYDEVEFNLDMAIVEIHISLGEVKKASERECLILGGSYHFSDLRINLYKAIIYPMVAHVTWMKFLGSSELPSPPDGEIPVQQIDHEDQP